MLKTGQKAPDFSLKTGDNELISLSDMRGKFVVLYFYPKDNTPGCTKEACDFRDNFELINRKGEVEILGISGDDTQSHKNFSNQLKLPFYLLSDTDNLTSKDYGVWKKKKILKKEVVGIERTTFLISPSGVILKIYENVKVKDHVKSILKDLDEIMEGVH